MWLAGQQIGHRRTAGEAWAGRQLDRVLRSWQDGAGFSFSLEHGSGPHDQPGLQGTEMWLATAWYLADYLDLGVGVDVGDESAVERAADGVEAALGVADIVVANAGILVLKPALDLTVAEFERVTHVNLTGSFVTARCFARRLVAARRPGTVIFSSSLFGLRGGAGNTAYSASKFGIIGMAQSMAAELAPAAIRVNSVCPGQVDSEMLGALFETRAAANGTTAAAERTVFEDRIPLGALGSTEEIADTYVYLASGLSSYVTGQHLVVDGGWTVG